MKKTYVTMAVTVSICLVVTVLTRMAAGNISAVQPPRQINTQTYETVIETTEPFSEIEKIYTLTEKEGKIVVYEKGIVNPVVVTDTYVRELPEYDIEKIKIGIEIHGDTALRKALEDYCS